MGQVSLRSLAPKGMVGGPFGSSLVSRDYVDDGIPVIRGANMGADPWLSGDFVYVSREKFERDLARNSATAGDLVFTQRGTLGQVVMIPEEGPDTYVVSQSQMRMRVDPSAADSRYVYYACTSNSFKKQIADRAISTGVPHINLGILGDLTIVTRTLDEQRAIAEVLGALDDKIAANTRLIETADKLARSITRAALTGERVNLTSVAEITMGSSPPGTSYNEEMDGVIFYQGVRDFGVRFPNNRVWTTEPVRMAEPSDTLLSVRAPVGRTNLAAESTCIGRGLAAVRSMSGYPMSMFHLLRADHAAWAPYEAEGTVFGSINKKQLAALQIATVRPEQSAKLEQELAAIEQRLASAIAESERLAATRDALLPLLMSGKVTVKDAESVVEGVA